MTEVKQKPVSMGRDEKFVEYVIARCQTDKGFAAHLRRADNPATEYQSWELLASFGVDLEWESERLPYVLVAAVIARSKSKSNGTLSLGKAIFMSYGEDATKDQAKMRLRRILAADAIPELCRLLRPLLTLFQSRVTVPLDYLALLQEIKQFGRSPQRIKARWAQQFYSSLPKKIDNEGGKE